MPKQLIAGEPIEVLVLALQQFKFRRKPEGMVHFNVLLERELALPFRRALMRIEAELLLEEADRLRAASHKEQRTPEQRSADALVALAQRIIDARTS